MPTMRFPVPVAALLTLGWAASAAGCPVCGSDTGELVRTGILDGQFVRNLMAVVLPFAVFLGVTAAIHLGWPPHGRQDHDRRHE